MLNKSSNRISLVCALSLAVIALSSTSHALHRWIVQSSSTSWVNCQI
jgi:hypothetical protein